MASKVALGLNFFNELCMHHIFLDECESTQGSFKQYWEHRDEDERYVLVSTAKQNSGVGRRSNTWLTGERALALSCSVRAQENLTHTPLALGVEVVNFFKAKGINLKLKWPNDILNSDGEKVGGLLCQTLASDLVLLGLGINLFLNNDELRELSNLEYPVGHLDIGDIDREKLAYELFSSLIETPKFSHEQWNSHCFHLNINVIISDGDQVERGLFIGIDKDGAALIKNDKGEIKRVLTGSLRISA